MQSTTQSFRLRAYSAGVALNEMGVTLMTRSCNLDAFDTFKDGLEMFQAARIATTSTESLINEKLSNASARLASAGSSARRKAVEAVELVVISDDMCLETLHAAVHELASTSQAIRISSSHSEELQESLDPATAIILLNVATSCQRHANTLKSKRKSRRHQQKALPLFQAAYHLLTTCHLTSIIEIDAVEVARVQLLSLLALQNLISCCSALNLQQDRLKHYCELCRLRENFLQYESAPLLDMHCKRSAAAA